MDFLSTPHHAQIRRGASKSRPSLVSSALLDGVSFDNDPVISIIPVTPTRKEDSYYQLPSVISNDILIDIPVEVRPARDTRRSKGSLKRVPSFPFPDLEGGAGAGGNVGEGAVGASASGSSVYPHSTSRSRSSHDGGATKNSSGNSSAWSTLSNRLFSDIAPDTVTSTQPEPGVFTKEYDKLARKHGLQPFPAGHMVDPSSASVSSVSVKRDRDEIPTITVPHGPIGKGTRILNRLLKRTDSTKDVSEKSRKALGHPLGHKRMSVSDLAGMGRAGRKDHLRGLHLEDMVKLGGVCEFKLPEKVAPGMLLVPACFHATANYLLMNGLVTPGLFRVEGNRVATEALYDYYQRQLGTSNGDAIVQTTSLATLPTHLTYTVNDVAHLFKALLAGLPGGLLGSPAVFQALYSIQSFLHTDPSLDPRFAKKVRPRMIALAIASLNLHFRITLICAVFGLLRCVALSTHGVVEESKITKPAETFTYLKEDSLGVIFGPLLLGDKSDQILVPAHEERGGLLLLPTIAPQPDEEPAKGKSKQKKNQGYVQMQREKARRAALVTEMVISEWENVVIEMRKIGVMEETRRGYEIPGLSSRASSEAEGVEHNLKPQTKGLSRSTEIGDRKLKERKSWKFESSGSRERLRPSSRISSRHGHGDNRATSVLYPESARHQHHLHLSNSKSMRHMKDNLHRTKSKAGDLLHFSSGSHRHKFSRASEMNSALLPATKLVSEQEVDLMETEGPVMSANWEAPSSALEDLSSLDIERGFEEEKLAQSLHEREHILAQDILVEVKPPIVLMGGGEGRNGESAGGIEENLSNDSTNTDQGARNVVAGILNLGGDIPHSGTFVDPPLPNAMVSTSKTVEPGSVREDLDLRPVRKVDCDRPIITHQEGEHMSLNAASTEEACSVRGTIGKVGDERDLSVMKPQLGGLRASKHQQGQNIAREPGGVLPYVAPKVTLAVSHGIGFEIPVGGELEMIKGGENIDTVHETGPSTTEDGEQWVTPPVGNTTPQPLGSVPLEAVEERDEGTEKASVVSDSPPQASQHLQNTEVNDKYILDSASAPLQSQPQPTAPLSRTVSVSYPFPPISPPPIAQSPTPSMNVLPLEIRSNSALYSEIRRLRALLEFKMAEADQMKKELELAKSMVTSESIGTLGQLLREAREEVKLWKNRAEWAEKRVKELMGQGQQQLDGIGDAARAGEEGARYDRSNRQVEDLAMAEFEGGKEGDRGRGWYNTFGTGRGRGFGRGGRGKTVSGEVAQRVSSWGVGLEEAGSRRGEAGVGSRVVSASVGRTPDREKVVTVGPRGPLRPPPPSRTLQVWGTRGRGTEKGRRGH